MEKEPQRQDKPAGSQEEVVFDMAAYQIRPKGPIIDAIIPLYTSPRSSTLDTVGKDPRLHDLPMEQVLYQLYTIQKKSMEEVGEVLGVNNDTVVSWLRKTAIPRRLSSDDQYALKRRVSIKKGWERIKKEKESKRKLLETRMKRGEAVRRARITKMGRILGCGPEVVLNDLYWKKEQSVKEISEIFGLRPSTINSWMDRLGIKRRSNTDIQTGRVGIKENNRTIVVKAQENGLFHHLTPGQLDLLTQRYNTEGGITMDGIAKQRKVTRQAIHQMEKDAISRLSKLLEELSKNK